MYSMRKDPGAGPMGSDWIRYRGVSRSSMITTRRRSSGIC